MKINKEILEKERELKYLKARKKELEKQDVFKISTNTAYIQNSKIDEVFNLWEFFSDWIKIKHEQGFNNEGSQYVEIIFKIKKEVEDRE